MEQLSIVTRAGLGGVQGEACNVEPHLDGGQAAGGVARRHQWPEPVLRSEASGLLWVKAVVRATGP